MKKINKSQVLTFISLHLLLFIYSAGGIFSKLAASESFLSWNYILYYGCVVLILMIYALGWQQVIKRMPLIVAYASKAITVIWGVVWGVFLFQEELTWQNLFGAVVIIVGIVLIVSEDAKVREE